MKNLKKLLLLTFCLYADSTMPSSEIEEYFSGVSVGDGDDFCFYQNFHNSGSYFSYFSYSRIYVTDTSISNYSLGIVLAPFLFSLPKLRKSILNGDYLIIPYYDVTHADVLYKSGDFAVFAGMNYKFDLVPTSIVLLAHYKKNRHILTLDVQSNIFLTVLALCSIERLDINLSAQVTYAYSF